MLLLLLLLLLRYLCAGGEGVVYIQHARSANSGYWFITLFAIRGRPMALFPLMFYFAYATAIVCLLMQDEAWMKAPKQVWRRCGGIGGRGGGCG